MKFLLKLLLINLVLSSSVTFAQDAVRKENNELYIIEARAKIAEVVVETKLPGEIDLTISNTDDFVTVELWDKKEYDTNKGCYFYYIKNTFDKEGFSKTFLNKKPGEYVVVYTIKNNILQWTHTETFVVK